MKKLIFAFLVVLVFGLSGNGNAVIISESIYGTVNSISGNASGIDIDDTILLFDVTYDNEGTSSTIYNDDGTANNSFTMNFQTIALYDPIFRIGDELAYYIMNNGGADIAPDMEWDCYQNTTVSGESFYTTHDDYSILANFPLSSSSNGSVRVRDGSSIYRMYLDNLERIVEQNNPVPEPSTMVLLGTGFLSVAVIRRKKMKILKTKS